MSTRIAESSKTVKAALKEARELIETKDYKSALRCCKRALNVDKNNYMALVFCGLCLGELDQQDQAVQVNKGHCSDMVTVRLKYRWGGH